MPSIRLVTFSLFPGLFLLWAAACTPAQPPTGPLDVDAEQLRPGLIAEYRSLANQSATVVRTDAKPAFSLGDSSPHPRIPPGQFEVAWNGVILAQEPGPISFSAYAGGDVTLKIDNQTLLDGKGESALSSVKAAAAWKREPGLYRITLRFRSRTAVPARLQLLWEGPTFAREPIPAWRFFHLVGQEPATLKQEGLAEQGRRFSQQFGCARCHSDAFPSLKDGQAPGPSLADAGKRLTREWLVTWLEDPAKARPNAHMPKLFSANRIGFVERWLIADRVLQQKGEPKAKPASGDHRAGRLAYQSIGCIACHFVPEFERAEQRDLARFPFIGLGDRFSADDLAAFLVNPHGRYPDGRMPRIALTADVSRNIAAYLLLWSPPTKPAALPDAPTPEEIRALVQRLNARDSAEAAAMLVQRKGCSSCHSGFAQTAALDLPLTNEKAGCLTDKTLPRFTLDAATRESLAAYLAVARQEKHASPFAERQRKLERAGCVRCHQRDGNRPPPIEEAASTLGGSFLQELPFQRAPRLTYPYEKYTRAHLLTAVRDGVTGLRGPRYSFRMPAFGPDAETLVRALAEADGELPAGVDAAERLVADPTIGPLAGPQLVGAQGYSCISCHVWNGKLLVTGDPGALGPDLTRVSGRIRRDWFDRYLDDPQRSHPGTPMPAIFERGKPALVRSVLDGEPARQKDALWAYFSLGKNAPAPKPAPPVPITAPDKDEGPIVAQIPIRLPDGTIVESISILWLGDDLLVYDLATNSPRSFFTGAQITRDVQGRHRHFFAAGAAEFQLAVDGPWQFSVNGTNSVPRDRIFHGYERLIDGVRLRWRAQVAANIVEIEESLRRVQSGSQRVLARELRLSNVPGGSMVELRSRIPPPIALAATATVGKVSLLTVDQIPTVKLTPANGRVVATLTYELPPTQTPPAWKEKPFADLVRIEGSLRRPGYRAIAYPRPKTIAGEDRVMPGAIAVNPRDGRVFIASMKTGELFVLRDPDDNGKHAYFENYAHGLFQDALSMLADDDALYVLHRRNLTRITETKGIANRFERVAALPHGVADTYDYAYGLARDKTGAFVFTYAPYANQKLPGAGGALRLVPGKPPQEIAYGFRNPLGWCSGPEGEVFYTDNQGEWVATNKLCHIVEGRYYGFPNNAQKEHTTRPFGKTAIWVPYEWAHSINGVTYDNTGGKFGPFAGQFFMAELTFGGAIIRANVERVNGEFQGACFPFWGKGLLGPLTLAFDPKGRLFVGGITEPGWMAQPDRGALFRIDFTGQTPFEMQSIHVRPQGFRIVFTQPVDRKLALDPKSYRLEHYRYEYTGAYGSPELDRTAVKVERLTVADDGLSVELTTSPLVRDRVYMISAGGVKSAKGAALVHTTGAYTLNEIPK